MTRHDATEGRGHKTPAASGHDIEQTAPESATPSIEDPSLDADLGAAFEFRGDQLEEELEAAKAQAADALDRAARAQAEFDNARKRLEARHADEVSRAAGRVISALLPVIDDLERAIEHSKTVDEAAAEGLVAVKKKMLEILAREGCTPVEPLGEQFDPARHAAVQMREDADASENTVVEVFQCGYEMQGRVLRPAMVIVSSGGSVGE